MTSGRFYIIFPLFRICIDNLDLEYVLTIELSSAADSNTAILSHIGHMWKFS